MSKVNLIFFKFEPQVPLITELAKLYGSREDFHVEMIENAMEVNQFLLNSPQGILFFQIKSKQDLQEAVGILKSNRKAIKKGAVKPACISTIQNRKVESILAKYGCQDILDVDAKAKTLTFKLDFWSKPIKKVIEKMEREEELRLSRHSKATENTSKAQEKKEFELVSPLELQSDFWLVKAKADYKRILKRYLIRLLGPSPYVGTWVELEPQPGDNQPTWKWVLKDPDNTDYIVDDGAWFFYGAKPEFDWKIKRWSFASDLPHLYFYNREGETFSKFKMKDGVVQIADNSEFATMREPMILETCDSKFNFEGEGQKEEDSSNLDGEGSAADRFGDEPIGGKGGPADSMGRPLEGKGSVADRLGDDPLSGKGGPADSMGRPLEGKASAADRYGDDPLSGKAATDKMGNSPLEGKGTAADRLGDDPLSGKGGPADSVGNPLEGKASAADRYGDDPLSGKAATDKMGNPVDGKGSAADRYGDDPLSGKAATDKMGNPVDGKGSAADRYGDDPLSGKAATDKMGNPVDGKGSAADRYGDKPLSGKIKTDPVPGPLDPKKVSIDPVKKALALEKRPELDPSLKDKIEKAESMSDLLPNIEDLKPSEIKEELESQGLSEDLLEELDLGQPLLEIEKAQEALDQLSPELQELIKKANTLADIIPDLDDLSAEELEERKKKLGLNDDILDALNLEAPLLKEQKKKNALEQLPPELQNAAKSATSLNDLIPDADQLTAEELSERKRKLGIDDDILDALDLGEPVLPTSLEDAKNHTIDNKKQEELEVGSTAELNDYFNARKVEQERLQEIAKKEGTSDYLEKEKAKRLARAAQAEESAEEIGDYYNEKKRKADELRKREEKLEKQYQARDASKKDELNKHLVDHGASQSGSSEIGTRSSTQEKEQELVDALGGGLTEGASGSFDNMIGEALEEKPEEKIEGEIAGHKSSEEVNTESGDISVVISQNTGPNNEINLICEFEDFYEDELVVKVPKGSYAFGVDTKVKTAVVLNYNGKKISVNGDGVVIEIESLNKQQETLIISLKNLEKEKYETFMTLYEERQESILDFMKLAKGY